MKNILKKLLPVPLLLYIKKKHENIWSGDYNNWQEAVKKCSGYEAENILQKVKNATLKVKSGEAVYERDSMLFDKVDYSWPLLSALLLASAKNKGRLEVLDYGGSLGSSYFQNKKYLDELEFVQWNVIEQPLFVACGQDNIQSDRLKFFYNAEEFISVKGLPAIIVISTTLPYLETPRKILKDLLTLRIPYLIIDNTVFNYEPRDRITIQTVPKKIYDASYPCWFLDYESLKNEVKKTYEIISEHENDNYIYLDGKKIQYKGFLGKLKDL